MDVTTKAALVIGITLVAVVLFNILLYYSVTRRSNRGGGMAGQIDLFRKAAGRTRNPWEEEDRNLQELARLARRLREDQKTDEDQ